VEEFTSRRGWNLEVTNFDTLEDDLRCAQVLWYLSDWHPPPDFVSRHVPVIEQFVEDGGGLLVGGLGWSYDQQGGPDGGWATAPYAADQLGAPFGFSFTTDAFGFDLTRPIVLQPGQ
jgi:hypothetical protein